MKYLNANGSESVAVGNVAGKRINGEPRDKFHNHGEPFFDWGAASNNSGKFRLAVEWDLKGTVRWVYAGPVVDTLAEVQEVLDAWFRYFNDTSASPLLGEGYNFIIRRYASEKMTPAEFAAWTLT